MLSSGSRRPRARAGASWGWKSARPCWEGVWRSSRRRAAALESGSEFPWERRMVAMRKIRVLIADDHAVLRDGLHALLNMYEDMEVVGEAGAGLEGLGRAIQLKPAVGLMDIAMPRLGGLEAALEIRQRKLPTKVLVLTQYDNKEYVFQMLKAGAAGYMLKKAAGTELVSAIRAVHGGESFLCPSAASAVVDRYLGETGGGGGG